MNIVVLYIIVCILIAAQVYQFNLFLKTKKEIDKHVESAKSNLKSTIENLQSALKDYDKTLDTKVQEGLSDVRKHIDLAVKAMSKRIGKREKETE